MPTVSVSLLKQISPFQTSTDKIIRHSEHNSILYSATKGSSLVSLHLLSQGCDASIIMLSKRARLERQEHSFHTLTVYMKWSALIFCQNGGTFSQRSPPDPPTFSLKWIFHWFFGIGGHSKQKATSKCHIYATPCLYVFPGLLGLTICGLNFIRTIHSFKFLLHDFCFDIDLSYGNKKPFLKNPVAVY